MARKQAPESADRNDRIDLRCAPHERQRWLAAAASEGLRLSEWIRRCLDRRAEDEERRIRSAAKRVASR